ncbi:MAG: hypothetical protein HKN63_03285 [Rhodobacteraceae bacterium]|nr:hypothetical protein [Paracoccaceae bacterium]
MTTAEETNGDDIALAGEYALHLLAPAERLAFERRLSRETGLRDVLRDFEEGFVTLADEIAPERPPRRLKRQLEARLFADPEKTGGLWLWSALAFVSGAVAALILAAILFVAVPVTNLTPPGASYQAELVAEDRSLVVRARYEPQDGRLSITRLAGTAAPGRVFELWLIAEGADAPVSLGVLPQNPIAAIDVSAEIVAALEAGTLAISDEPPGGSPTGAPTGTVLAVGAVITL